MCRVTCKLGDLKLSRPSTTFDLVVHMRTAPYSESFGIAIDAGNQLIQVSECWNRVIDPQAGAEKFDATQVSKLIVRLYYVVDVV